MDPLYSHLSMPMFYECEEPEPTETVYFIIDDCPCISDEKFEKELLGMVSEKILSKKKHSTRKRKPSVKIY